VLFMVVNLMHFTLGVRMLNRDARLLGLWREPVLAAAITGLLVNFSGITLWPTLATTLSMLGDVAIPLMLFALGVRLTRIDFTSWHIAVLGALFRPVAGVLLAWTFATLVGLEAQLAAMLIVFGALPPAVLNFMFAEHFHQEPERVAAIVMIGNLSSVLSLPLVLYWVL